MVDKIAYRFDPFELAGVEPPKTGKAQAKRDICNLVLEEVLSHVGEGKSPVAGGKWRRSLSKEYKARKAQFSSSLFANMELTGDMLDALECVVVGKDLELRIKGKEADKADGHNNHTGRSSLPAREFIPKTDQTFRKSIRDGIKQIAMEYIEDGQS